MESSPSCHQDRGVGGRQDLHCYIRRSGSPWVLGRKHHEIALNTYLILHVTPLEPGQTPIGAFICADHEDGGQFYAYFTYVGNNVYQFLDQYKNTVQIVIETPARIAYINRITDC
jgi:hypothetical protein